MKSLSRTILNRLRKRFERLYGDQADHCMHRLDMTIGRYGIGFDVFNNPQPPDEEDVYLITYGDMIQSPEQTPLQTLTRFLTERTQKVINTVHILPFFPYSSDDGFSVIDYMTVDPALGSWQDVEDLSKHYDVMADLVLNHVSRKSMWFREYVMGTAPFRHFFHEVDPESDLSDVVRPRSLPLLTKTQTREGTKHIWTTFSDDQIDLNFANPDVLFEFIDILMYFRSMGIRVIRMDAIAYLWKEIGTSCIHHDKTHEVVKVFRDLIDMIMPDMTLLTETNVPHEENIRYFGQGDEAHMVYQFSLPPLTLHALQTGNTSYLTEWAQGLGTLPPGCTFLNFTASHDGIGVRPLQGLVPDQELDAVIESVKERGGQVSMKQNSDGTESPYELNITYLSALADPGEKQLGMQSMAKFLCSQTVALELQGVPAIYFNNLVGGINNDEGVKETGRARTINRGKWDFDTLSETLDNKDHFQSIIFKKYMRLLKKRKACRAFHPDALQQVFNLSPSVFVVQRTAPESGETIVAINNLTAVPVQVSIKDKIPALQHASRWKDLIKGEYRGGKSGKINLGAYESVWLRA